MKESTARYIALLVIAVEVLVVFALISVAMLLWSPPLAYSATPILAQMIAPLLLVFVMGGLIVVSAFSKVAFYILTGVLGVLAVGQVIMYFGVSSSLLGLLIGLPAILYYVGRLIGYKEPIMATSPGLA